MHFHYSQVTLVLVAVVGVYNKMQGSRDKPMQTWFQ